MEKKTNSLKIKNRNLTTLLRFLASVPLAGKESRERTRFIEVCEPRIIEMDKLRNELLQKFSEKDEAGQPVLVENPDGTNRYDVSPTNLEEFQTAYNAYGEEDFTLDILDGNISKVRTVRDLILNTDQKFSGQTAAEYDKWCDAFEALELE